jgi:hypothetical protein
MHASICRKSAFVKVVFGQLQGEVPGVPDQPPAGLEQPLRETRERPVKS